MSIALRDCKHGWLYSLYSLFSRNFSLGVYNYHSKGFIGIREKFGDRFLDTEIHIDEGGSACPSKAICEIPNHMEVCAFFETGENTELFLWIAMHEHELEGDLNA